MNGERGQQGAAASWTFRSAGDGTAEVVNRSAGACPSAKVIGGTVATGDCDGVGGSRLWRPGSVSTLTSVFGGGCLGPAFGGGVSARPCESGAASRRRSRA